MGSREGQRGRDRGAAGGAPGLRGAGCGLSAASWGVECVLGGKGCLKFEPFSLDSDSGSMKFSAPIFSSAL